MKKIFFSLLYVLFIFSSLSAEVPNEISFSARLTENGLLVGAGRRVKFGFCDAEILGSQVAAEIGKYYKYNIVSGYRSEKGEGLS